jgi:Fur family peroxide stress response transcriptional regulator
MSLPDEQINLPATELPHDLLKLTLTNDNYYRLVITVQSLAKPSAKSARPLGDPKSFRELCAAHGLAATHQRQVLYEVMQTMPGHPSPEEVYARIKQRIPSISLATVYKNIHLFLESGVLQEVSPHHGSLRVEMNGHQHHHLVCSQCKGITDIGEEQLGLHAKPKRLPGGFQVQRFAIDVIGICAACQKASRA